jgi:hypothetical protein
MKRRKKIMKTVFNKTKVKSWIKKTHKRPRFACGYGYITDGNVMLVVEPHMHPTILELFGTLTPECKYSSELFQETITLPDDPIEVIDSQLEFFPRTMKFLLSGSNPRVRIFYDPGTGKKLTIDGAYFDLLDYPRGLKFYTDDAMTGLWIMYDDDVVGAVGPVRLEEQLSHINFIVNAIPAG